MNSIKENKRTPGYILWMISILLILPMIVVCAVHFLSQNEGLHATGFLQYDQFYYMANAREHYDSGVFSITYGLPFSHFEGTPRIYFHPLFLVLGFIHNATGWQPGYIYILFGLLAAVICVRIAIALYDNIVCLQSTSSWLGLLFFIWGGGVLTLAGITHAVLTSQNITAGALFSIDNLFHFDPVEGFWFLNFGRNFFYSTEAYYHAVFLGTVLLIFRKKYLWAIATLALMMASHPFSGIQLLLIVACWSISNRFILKRKLPNFIFLSIVVALIIFHLGYYLFFLNTSPEHRWLQEAWSLDWSLPFESQVFAYAPLLLLIVWNFSASGSKFLIDDSRMFFLAIWAIISLLLANHELFIEPKQPLHFTRGYIWIPLFLLASKQLVYLIERIIERRNFFLKIALLLILTTGALSDNLLWFGSQIHSAVAGKKSLGFYLSNNDKEVLNLMNSPEYDRALVVSSDHLLGYIATVYSPLRSWASHGYNTPYYDKRVNEIQGFFERGETHPEWDDSRLFVISLASGDYHWRGNIISSGLREVLRNSKYVVYSGIISTLNSNQQ